MTLRETHERPDGMDEGAVIMSGLSPQRILQAVEMTLAQFQELGNRTIEISGDGCQSL